MVKLLKMFEMCFFNLKTFRSYNLLTNKKQLKIGYRLKLIFLYKTVRNIQYYLRNDHISKTVPNKTCNLQIRLEKFIEQTKKAQRYQLVGTTISINGNTKKAIKHKSCFSLGTGRKNVINLQNELLQFIGMSK